MPSSGPPSGDSSPADVRTGADTVASGKSPIGPDRWSAATPSSRSSGACCPMPVTGQSRNPAHRGRPGHRQDDPARRGAVAGRRVHARVRPGCRVGGRAGPCRTARAGAPVRSCDESRLRRPTPLRTALGWASPGAPADPFLVAAATLSLLAAAAERTPVLVTVDDLQWLDRESAAAILFAARRLGPDAVAFVFSAGPARSPRSAARHPGARADRADRRCRVPALPCTAPAPSSSGWSRTLRATRWPCWRSSQRLDRAQWVGAAPLPDPLPVGDRLSTFTGRC